MSTPPFDPAEAELIAAAPLPTPKTLKNRKNVFYQFFRFMAFNIRILRVVGMSH